MSRQWWGRFRDWLTPSKPTGFTLRDFMAQMGQVKSLGSIGKVMGMIPGMSELTKNMGMSEGDVERQLAHMWGMYDSMTDAERDEVALLDARRRRRVARGAGVTVDEVSQFVRQFEMSRETMRNTRQW